jgi:predicted phosphodiesterase
MFGVIGDVHTQAPALETLLGFYAQHDLSAVLCCGDVVDGPGDPERCVQLLQENNCFVTRGNHERWAAEGIMRGWDAPRLWQPAWRPDRVDELPAAVGEWVASLPLTLRFTSRAGVVEMAHGIGADDMNQLGSGSYGLGLETNKAWQQLLASGRPNMVVKGHTHCREVFYKDGVVVVDGGTLLGYGPPGGVMVDLEERRYCMVEVNGTAATAAPWAPLPVVDIPVQMPALTPAQQLGAVPDNHDGRRGRFVGRLGRREGRTESRLGGR